MCGRPDHPTFPRRFVIVESETLLRQTIRCRSRLRKVIYCVARGGPNFAEMALGLSRSLRLIGDRSELVLATDIRGYDWNRHFDEVIELKTPRSALDKLNAFDHVQADAVLALDVDMLAFKRSNDIFATGAGRPFAVQGSWDDKDVFHERPLKDFAVQYGLKDGRFPRFNGGLMYYEPQPKFFELLDAFRWAEANYDRLGFPRFRQGFPSEEVCVLDGMLKVGHVDLFPDHLQFQHSMTGLLSEFRLNILQNECQATCKAWDRIEFARPYFFHAWRYKDFAMYWRQLRMLREIERRTEGVQGGFLPRAMGIRRSVERRWMRHVRRWQ